MMIDFYPSKLQVIGLNLDEMMALSDQNSIHSMLLGLRNLGKRYRIMACHTPAGETNPVSIDTLETWTSHCDQSLVTPACDTPKQRVKRFMQHLQNHRLTQEGVLWVSSSPSSLIRMQRQGFRTALLCHPSRPLSQHVATNLFCDLHVQHLSHLASLLSITSPAR